MVVFGVVNGQYTIGFLVLFYTYFNYIWESIGRLCGISLDFIIQKYGVSRMMEIFEEPLKIDENSGKVPFPAQWKKITIHNLCFSYGETEVLHSLCFDISKGERIGIVGISGAGKSTLFKLLLKEHENYSGTILIDGIDLRDINHTSFQEKTAVVLQETEVFHFSLQSNITLAHPRQELQKEFLDQAITVAHVQEFAEKLPQGMKTMIGEKGIKLSGGEKQRVGIARAIYKQPDILFLDEATSHLDSESELKIRDSLHHIFRNVTAIVIAHRLSTIQEMDRIIVLENGRIVESDTFDNLMKAKGRFRELWEKQNIPLY
jgi:ATP-binding cassette subfamily B protein